MEPLTPEALKTLPLYGFARLIRLYWSKVGYAARPYIDALSSLTTINDKYGCEDARMIVAYLLGNLTTFRGPEARLIKAELNRRLKS